MRGEIPPECRPGVPAAPARRENSQLERREKTAGAVVWHLHKGWGPKAATLSERAEFSGENPGGVMGVRLMVTVESLSQKPVCTHFTSGRGEGDWACKW